MFTEIFDGEEIGRMIKNKIRSSFIISEYQWYKLKLIAKNHKVDVNSIVGAAVFMFFEKYNKGFELTDREMELSVLFEEIQRLKKVNALINRDNRKLKDRNKRLNQSLPLGIGECAEEILIKVQKK